MKDQALLQEAKQCIIEELAQAGLKPIQILLFGSRARGQARSDSDWDFLIVVDHPLSGETRRRLAARLVMRLGLAGLPADILLLPYGQFARYRDDVGHIAYYAVREGFSL